MTIIRRPSPFADLGAFRSAMDRLFDEASFRPLTWGGVAEARLPLDITSSEEAILIEAALPGVPPEAVDITVHQDTLTISVRQSTEEERKEGERVYREVRRSSGSRTLTLPSGLDLDKAAATFENGMLRLAIPRAEQAKPRQIPVTPVTEGHAPAVTAGQGSAEASAEDSPQA
jgi:HSP20 family protein